MTIREKQHWMNEVLRPKGSVPVDTPAIPTTLDPWASAIFTSGWTSDELVKKVALHFRLGVADIESAETRVLKLVPEKTARRYTVFPLSEDDKHLYVATTDPTNIEMEQAVTFASGRTPVFRIASPKSILEAIDRRYSPDKIIADVFAPSGPKISNGLRLLKDSEPVVPHVLIVDDDVINRRVAQAILEKQGYRVSEAVDGEDAIEKVSGGPPFALIILDLLMPKLGGREVLAKLKGSAATSRIPVIVLTSLNDEAVEAELIEKGADDYIRKPLDPVRFKARIGAVLRRASA